MKKIILPIIGLICLAAFMQGTLPEAPDKVKSDQIIASFFAEKNKWSRPEDFPDTTLKFSMKSPDDGSAKVNYVTSYCSSSPAYLSRFIGSKFIPEESSSDEKTPSEPNKKSVGINVIKTTMKTVMGYDMIYYDSKAILSAFNSVYNKPTEKFNGISLQKIYDVAMKDFMRESAVIVGKVMAKKIEFVKLSNDYLAAAKRDSSFDGVTFSDNATDKLLGKDTKDIPCIGGYNGRIVSMMLRRQIDGTLPTVLGCLKTIIKDYDPAYYTKISNSF